jgi:undecaprenyl-diphosphatase
MEFLKAVFLGIIQGLTEFLPISSSAHLVILKEILKYEKLGLGFDVFLHFGTLLAVLFKFRSLILDLLKNPFNSLNLSIIIACLATAPGGLLVHFFLKGVFSSGAFASFMLLLTGFYLFSTRKLEEGRKELPTFKDAFFIGLSQALAVLPGLSRSGLTIATGLHLGLKRKGAFYFSFLLAVPSILGAMVLEGEDVLSGFEGSWRLFLLGGFSAFLSGYLALSFLLKKIQKGELYQFAPYCWGVSLAFWVYKVLEAKF